MRVNLSLLRRYRPELPSGDRAVGSLLEDVGIEVKRLHDAPGGAVATLELLANRGDHHCYLGIAREAGARLAVPTELPPLAALTASDDEPPTVESPSCLGYGVARCTLAADAAALPAELAEALMLNGEHTGLLPVDAGNWTGREIGQPVHVYDADRLVGPLRVRLSQEGESAELLDAEGPEAVPAGLTVIADDAGIVAVAGVIGARRAAVSSTTRRLVVESALFDPVAVRSAARALRRQTAAVTRFERGADPELVEAGAARTVQLLAEWGALAPDAPLTWSAAVCPADPRIAPRGILLDLDRLDAYYAVEFDREEVGLRLSCLGFASQQVRDRQLAVTVPGHRLWDVFNPECLYEEIGRVWSFDSFPAVLPPTGAAAPPSERQRTRASIEQTLIGYGFFEVVTDGFYSRSSHDRLDLPADSPLSRHLELNNAIDKAFSLLKNNGLLHALDVADYNQRHGLTCGKYFEFTHLFEPVGEADHRERPVLWGMLWGEETHGAWQTGAQGFDFWYLKGVLEELAHGCGAEFGFDRASGDVPAAAELLHPNRHTALTVDGRTVGLCGEVHPTLAADWKLRGERALYFELDWTVLGRPDPAGRAAGPVAPADELPEHPVVKRNLALHLPVGLTAGEVAEHIRTVSPLSLAWIHVADLFVREDVRAHTFELAFDNDGTVAAKQVNAVMEGITTHVLDRFRDRGVYQR